MQVYRSPVDYEGTATSSQAVTATQGLGGQACQPSWKQRALASERTNHITGGWPRGDTSLLCTVPVICFRSELQQTGNPRWDPVLRVLHVKVSAPR